MCEIDKKLLGMKGKLPGVVFSDHGGEGDVIGELSHLAKGCVIAFGVSLAKAAEHGQSFDISQILREGRSGFPVYAVFDRIDERSGRVGIFCRRFGERLGDYKKEMEFFDLLTITKIIVVARPGTLAYDVMTKLIQENDNLLKKLRQAEILSEKLQKLFPAAE
jgi:hypothetical protein